MKIDPEKWPDRLKAVCRERCAEMGEPPCFEVDQWINPRNPDCGKVCDECAAGFKTASQPIVSEAKAND